MFYIGFYLFYIGLNLNNLKTKCRTKSTISDRNSHSPWSLPKVKSHSQTSNPRGWRRWSRNALFKKNNYRSQSHIFPMDPVRLSVFKPFGKAYVAHKTTYLPLDPVCLLVYRSRYKHLYGSQCPMDPVCLSLCLCLSVYKHLCIQSA